MDSKKFRLDNSDHCFKEVHNEPTIVTQFDKSLWRNILCLEPRCNSVFETTRALMEHLIELHEFSFELEEFEVTNWQEFQTWKDLMEEKEKYNYVLFSRKYDKVTNQTLSLTFSCQGCRHIKEKEEPIQLAHACTSHIEAKEMNESLITIEHIRSHYGHGKAEVVKIERSLDETEDKEIESQPGVNSMKVEETKKNFVNKPMEFTNEGLLFSLDLWVQECHSHQDNPVIFYKPSNYELRGFSVNDFCLIVMTSFQADMLQKYPDIVAIDSTYGLDDWDFELTTLLIIDKKGELFPAAFMLTNNDSKSMSTLFFDHIREKVGGVSSQIFISEMTGKFYDSWCEAMGPVPNWLFCSCHLEHIWKLNLLNIKNKDKRVWVYETMKELQLTSDEEQFVNRLDSAINEIMNDPDTFAFGEAFQNSYVDCIRQWVYCYRKDLGLESDIFLDNMKKMVRYPGYKKRMKKRDEIICDVLQYVRDKTVACIVEEAEGDLKQEIDQNHDRSVQSAFEILRCNDCLWKLRREGDENIVYSVGKLSSAKCCDVTCYKCDICVHMYSCSCPTYFINVNICEHIHHIASTYPNSKNQPENADFVSGNSAIVISKMANKVIRKLQNADFDSMPENVSSQILNHLVSLNKLVTFIDNVNNKVPSTEQL